MAGPVFTDSDYPPFDRAMMDGFAVRSADVGEGPTVLQVAGCIAAGGDPVDRGLEAGQAMQINTGGPIPPGCDAVIRVEDTSQDDRKVTLHTGVKPGQHIARRGSYVRAGQQVVDAGVRLGPGAIGAAASAGMAQLEVYEVPAVGILGTGSELVEPGVEPGSSQIRDSNRFVLDGLVRRCGARPVDLGLAKDDPEVIRSRIEQGLKHPFLCISGGVSMGAFDFVPRCLTECGAKIEFHKVALKPGKPTLLATTESGTVIFGLPGNPVSVFVSFCLFVEPALAKYQGHPQPLPRPIRVRLADSLGATGNRRTYRPATVRPDTDGVLRAAPLVWHGSGDPFGLSQANALIETRPGDAALAAGDTVSVLLLEWP